MPLLSVLPEEVPEWVLRAAHDLGLAAWCGGAYMGAVGLNGASREVDDPTQRGRVANAGWFRWGAIVPVAIGLHLAGGVGLTRRSATPGRSLEQRVAAVRAAAFAAAILSTVLSGWYGRQVSKGGDVPAATAVIPIADTPREVASAMRVLRVLQWAIPVSTATLVVLHAWQQSHGGTRVLPGRWVRTAGLR